MIGKNIYEIRKKRGYTLSELAKRARISKSYLSNIERSINKNPSIDVLIKIAGVLDVELKALLGSAFMDESPEQLGGEWIEFVTELKKSGIKLEQLQEYKIIVEFIKWQNQNTKSENNL